MLLQDVVQQEEIHTKSEVHLQMISHFQRVNAIPPLGIPNLRKDKMFKYMYIVEAWKFEVENAKTTIERANGLAKGIWNNCLDAMEEWGIREIKEMLETFTSKAKDLEQIWASLETEITDLLVLDVETMEISMVDPTKLMAQIKE